MPLAVCAYLPWIVFNRASPSWPRFDRRPHTMVGSINESTAVTLLTERLNKHLEEASNAIVGGS